MRSGLGFVALLLCAATAFAAATGGYAVDAQASSVKFQLRALGWWPVRGSARAEGEITIRDERAEIRVQVPLTSLQMGRDSDRDWALSSEFFAAADHPQLRFDADAITLATLRRGGAVQGALTVRGLTRAARFVLEPSDCTAQKTTCRVRASGELSRRDFGMRTRRFTLSDRIQVMLDLQLVPKS